LGSKLTPFFGSSLMSLLLNPCMLFGNRTVSN
jgi:hypothetical protein